MSNMSYCRFQNTVIDLRDCLEHLYDEDLSDDEQRARRRLIKFCREIVEAADEDDSLETLPGAVTRERSEFPTYTDAQR